MPAYLHWSSAGATFSLVVAIAAAVLSGCTPLAVDPDGDGFSSEQGDCLNGRDEVSRRTWPGAAEVCDGVDNDCNGQVDDGLPDLDNDGVCGTPSSVCFPPFDCDCDCDDNDAERSPLNREWCDGKNNDCDSTTEETKDGDGDTLTICDGDCNDRDGSIFPAAAETCNGVDDNCNGSVDEGFDDNGDGTSDCVDDDLDGFMEHAEPQERDCDDLDHYSYPGAQEYGDHRDNDCDGQVDEEVKPGTDADRDHFPFPVDCDDRDPYTHPGAPEVCDGLDNDCDRSIDEDWDRDSDGVSTCAGDCNDNNPAVYPGTNEMCDLQDNDCDGRVDEETTGGPWYLDADSDGYGDNASLESTCIAPSKKYVPIGGDCDDLEANVYPDANEVCDGLDNDCDRSVDEGVISAWYLDADGDGYGGDDTIESACTAPSKKYVTIGGDCDDLDSDVYPDANEVCDGLDNDCDGDPDNHPACEYRADRYVYDPDADSINYYPGLSTAPSESIQTAIDLASDGDVIVVGPGTYLEHLDFLGKSLEVVGWAGAARTTVGDSGPGSVVMMASGGMLPATARLDGFTIQGGAADTDSSCSQASCRDYPRCFGGGLYVSNYAPAFRNLVIVSNTASKGGGVAICGASLILSNVTLRDNFAEDAGGQGWGGGVYVDSNSTVLMDHALIANNVADYGGGFYSVSTSLELSHAIVEQNDASMDGGALYLPTEVPTTGSTHLSQAVITSNNAGGSGGGILLGAGAVVNLERSIVAFNDAGSGPNGHSGEGSAGFTFSDTCFFYESDGVQSSGLEGPSQSPAQEWTAAPVFSDKKYHLAPGEFPVDASEDALFLDPDGTKNDPGAYGGPDADQWDLDGDSYPNWFWPGSPSDAPAGFNAADFDCDDRDSARHEGCL